MKKTADHTTAGLARWLMLGLACSSVSLPLLAADLASCGVISAAPTLLPIEINTSPPSSAVPHALLGANILYTVDDSDTWRAGLEEKLKRLEPGSLRFPGGEVADSYDWESGRAEVTKKSSTDLRPINYQDFLKHAAAIKAKNIYFVVNLEGAFNAPGDRENNLRKYADKAARLVSAVKKQAHPVTYWEIGNESYLAGTSAPLKASEYAHALKIFASAMRQADPSIRIVANGPSDEHSQGFADRLDDEQLSLLRTAPEQLCDKQPRKDCQHQLNRQTQRNRTQSGWWGVLAREAPEAFDDVAIHSYSLIKNEGMRDGTFPETERIVKLKRYLTKMRGREAGVAVTEWNGPPIRQGELSSSDVAISNAIKFGNFMAAGVQDAIFWPLRYPTSEGSARALLSMQGLNEMPMHRALQLINSSMRGQFVAQEKIAEGIYALQTRNPTGMALMLVNTRSDSQSLALSHAQAGTSVQVRQLTGETMSGGQICAGRMTSKGVTVALPPRSITTANFTQ